jgi:integrase
VAEIRALFAISRDPRWAETARAFLFGCYTGLRISDLRTLVWGMINRESLQIIKRQKKTRAGAYIPLGTTAWAMIDDGAEHAADEKIFDLPYTRRTYAELRA